jgi:hypothetical protein
MGGAGSIAARLHDFKIFWRGWLPAAKKPVELRRLDSLAAAPHMSISQDLATLPIAVNGLSRRGLPLFRLWQYDEA